MAETTPYGIEYVNALNVQDENSSTRKVCIVDSGYDMNHPDLPNNPAILSGQSFVPGYDWDTDENSHGTHVAGTIMALGGNGIGVKGVIRNGLLKAHISKVFDASGSAFTSTVIAGFESCVKAESNVISMSLAGGPFNQVFADAIADAYGSGVLTFASSGNSGDFTLSYPASYPFVTSVASITNTYARSYFSAFNDEVDLCAPGSDILSTIPGGLYDSFSGTSMACPHVAGVAALVWSHYPQLHHDTLRKILEETAIDLPLGRNDGHDVEFGHGLVNALAALEAVLASVMPIVSPVPSVTASLSNSPSISPSAAQTSTPTEFCPEGVEVKVDIFTDDWSEETSWEIKDATNSIIEKRNSFPLKRKLYEDYVCLPQTDTCEGSEYTFAIYDAHGDGLCCNWGEGYYTVTILGDVVASGSSFASSATASLCRQSYSTNTPSVTPSLTPSVTPSLSGAPSEFCPNGVEVIIKIFTDEWPSETSWEIKGDNDSMVWSKSIYSSGFSLYEDKACLDICEGSDHNFTIYDSYGDGLCCNYGNGNYEVYVGEDKIVCGASFGSSETTSLCTARTSSISSISSHSKDPSFKPNMKPSSCESFMRHPIGIMLIGLLLVQVHVLL